MMYMQKMQNESDNSQEETPAWNFSTPGNASKSASLGAW